MDIIIVAKLFQYLSGEFYVQEYFPLLEKAKGKLISFLKENVDLSDERLPTVCAGIAYYMYVQEFCIGECLTNILVDKLGRDVSNKIKRNYLLAYSKSLMFRYLLDIRSLLKEDDFDFSSM